jgi:hypothetical protein
VEHFITGKCLIIDEVMQVLRALLNSSTCKAERVQIIKNLKQLIINVIDGGGQIIIADADLSDIAIDFFKGLIGRDLKTWILENTYQPKTPWIVHHFQDKSPARMFRFLENRLHSGEKALICTSSQQAKSPWGTRNLESTFRKKFPHLRILRIDSETVQDPTHEACGCTENLNEIVVNYDLVIASPTIQTGVSIDVKHFDSVWGSFQGIQSPDVVRQHLSRYRIPCPRYIWISAIGNRKSFVGDRSTTVAGLLSSQNKQIREHILRFSQLGFEENLEGVFDNICLKTWAIMGALLNGELKTYAQTVLRGLEAEGHIIVPVCGDDKSIFIDDECANEIILPHESEVETFTRQIQQNRDQEYSLENEQTVQSHSIDDLQFHKLSKQARKTNEERLILKKALLERKYNIPIEDPDIVVKDDQGWYPQIKLHYYFTVGRRFLNFHDQTTAAKQLAQGDGDYFQPDMNKSLLSFSRIFRNKRGES